VVESYIRFTLKLLISWEERKANSTPCMASETGAAMFIMADEKNTYLKMEERGKKEKLRIFKAQRREVGVSRKVLGDSAAKSLARHSPLSKSS
jgi:hypothetical protein